MTVAVFVLTISMARLKSFSRIAVPQKKGRIFRPFFYLLAWCFHSAAADDGSTRVQFAFDSTSYSETTSLVSIAGDWNDPVNPGNQAWSYSRMSLGYQNGPYSLQWIARDDSDYRFDNETASFVYLTRNQLPLTAGQSFRLQIKPDRLSSHGLRLGYRHTFDAPLQLSLFASLLQPDRFLHGNLQGQAIALDSNDYDFSFASDLRYDRDPLYDSLSRPLSGQGYALDILGSYAINTRWNIDFQWLDAISAIDIRQATRTRALASSQIKQYDDNGYLTYDPVVSGQDSTVDVRYRYSPQIHLSLQHRFANFVVRLQHHRVFGQSYQTLQADQIWSDGVLRWSVIPQFSALGIRYQTASYSVGLETDRLNWRQARYLSIHTRYFWRF